MRPFKPQISFGRAESSRVVPCVGARAHVAVPKMLSRDRPCAFFVRVMHPWKPQISLGRFGSARPGWVGSCRAVCGCAGTRGRAKNSKSSPPVCLLHVRAARLLDAPSGLRSGRAPMESPNFVRAVHTWKPQISFGWVGSCRVWVPVQTCSGESVGSCRAVSGCSGTCGHAKNVKA